MNGKSIRYLQIPYWPPMIEQSDIKPALPFSVNMPICVVPAAVLASMKTLVRDVA